MKMEEFWDHIAWYQPASSFYTNSKSWVTLVAATLLYREWTSSGLRLSFPMKRKAKPWLVSNNELEPIKSLTSLLAKAFPLLPSFPFPASNLFLSSFLSFFFFFNHKVLTVSSQVASNSRSSCLHSPVLGLQAWTHAWPSFSFFFN